MQLYINDIISSVTTQSKNLKDLKKYLLNREKRKVHLKLNHEDLSLFDRDMNFVVSQPGTFEVMLGSSSKDIKLKGEFEVKN